MDLDDLDTSLDKEGFLAAAAKKADMVQDGHRVGVEAAAAAPLAPPPAGIAYAGMGGSGIAADLARDALQSHLGIPFTICKSHDLPAHVQGDWHLLAVSYSGDTEETLSATRQALDRGCNITAFTTGGQLAQMVDDVATQPTGHHPRMAVAHAWSSVMGWFQGVGLTPGPVPAQEAAQAVQAVIGACGPDVVAAKNEAKQWADQLAEPFVKIYATPACIGVADHLRRQLNENSKKIAETDVVPECNHNDINAWGDDPNAKRSIAVMLHESDPHPEVAARIAYMRSRYQEWGVVWLEKDLGPVASFREHVVAQAGALQFVDYVSLFAAFARDRDPSAIPVIQDLKAHLRATP